MDKIIPKTAEQINDSQIGSIVPTMITKKEERQPFKCVCGFETSDIYVATGHASTCSKLYLDMNPQFRAEIAQELCRDCAIHKTVEGLRSKIAQEIRERIESLQLHCDTCRCTECEELREFWQQYEVKK